VAHCQLRSRTFFPGKISFVPSHKEPFPDADGTRFTGDAGERYAGAGEHSVEIWAPVRAI